METLSVGEQFAEKVKDNAKKDRIRRMMPIILLVVMTAIGAITQKNFFSARNLVNILYQMSIPLVISVSLMFVLLLGRCYGLCRIIYGVSCTEQNQQ